MKLKSQFSSVALKGLRSGKTELNLKSQFSGVVREDRAIQNKRTGS